MVSILIAVRNGEIFLPDTLKSIAQQTYKNWELVAVDDASGDNTLSIMMLFQKRYPDQVAILQNNQNLGLTKSLIRAVKEAHGEYLARIDAGDTFAPDKLEKQINFLADHPECELIGCNYMNIFLPSNQQKRSNVPLTDSQIRASIIKKNPFAHSCIIIRTDIYKKTDGYDPNIKYGQDYELWFRVLKITKATNLPDNLCTRTMSDESISYRKQKEQMWQCFKTRWKYMNKLNPLHYLYLLEPLLIVLVPKKIKRFLRKF